MMYQFQIRVDQAQDVFQWAEDEGLKISPNEYRCLFRKDYSEGGHKAIAVDDSSIVVLKRFTQMDCYPIVPSPILSFSRPSDDRYINKEEIDKFIKELYEKQNMDNSS